MSEKRNRPGSWAEHMEDLKKPSLEVRAPVRNWWYQRGYASGANGGFLLGLACGVILLLIVYALI